MRALGGVARLIASVAVAAVLVGVPVIVLEAPPVTQALVARFCDARAAGIPRADTLRTAEAVRRYVTDAGAPPLPATLDGRPAFDEAAASHLRDVRRVLGGAGIATAVAALSAAVLLGAAVSRRNVCAVTATMRAAAWGTIAVLVACAAFAAVDFGGFFSAFHGLFFAAGTWTFPEGSLLIQLFPEPLWATLGALWGAGVLLGAGTMLVTAHVLGRSGRGQAREDV